MPRPLKPVETVRYVTTRIALTEPLDDLIEVIQNMSDIAQNRIVIEGWTPETTVTSPRAPQATGVAALAAAKPGRKRGRPPKPAGAPPVTPPGDPAQTEAGDGGTADTAATTEAAEPATDHTQPALPTPMPGLGQPAGSGVQQPVAGGRAQG